MIFLVKEEVKYRMFVPLGGGGATDGNAMISPLLQNHCRNPFLQKVSPDLKETAENAGTKLMKGVLTSSSSREKTTIGNNRKEPIIPLDLTKSHSTDDTEKLFRRRSSLSPGESLNGNDRLSNKRRHTSGNSENEGNKYQDKPSSPSTNHMKNMRDHSPITDIDQRTPPSSLGTMLPTILPGVVGDGMLSTGGSLLPQQEAILKLQQKEFEAQLSFLKTKHLEIMKNQQQQQLQQRQPLPQQHQSNISRCEECNINFSKHQNYVAHKKYYCSANANKTNPPSTAMQIVSDNDDEELVMNAQSNNQHLLPSISPRVSPSKKDPSPNTPAAVHRTSNKSMSQRTPSVSPSASIGSNQSVPTGVSAMAMQAAAQAAINNFLAMSTSMQGNDNAATLMNGPAKDLLLLKQQQSLSNKDTILSKEAALQALKAAAASSSSPSNHEGMKLNSNNNESSSPSPQEKLLMCASLPTMVTSKTPPLGAPLSHSNTATGLPLPHFCCEGCGIKFKSVSNLQAHQARYCAGLRKAGAEESAMGNAFETMIKRMATQQGQTSGKTASSLAPPPPPSHLMSGMQADMMSFINARSLEQQLHQVEAAKVAAAAARLSEVSEKEDSNPPTAGPAAMAAMAAAISAANAASTSTSSGASLGLENIGGSDDYCCILCGYKESSVERLKDHINMHFIGHVKKPQHSTTSFNEVLDSSTIPNTTRSSKSPQHAPNSSSERMSKPFSNGNENSVQSPPEPKKIKLEGQMGHNGNKEIALPVESPPIHRTTPDTRDSTSPNTDSQVGLPFAFQSRSITKKVAPQQELNLPHISESKQGAADSGETTATPNHMRCTSCDITFSQMSNYLAHKKYYCRGLLLSTSPVPTDIKPMSSGDATKVGVAVSSEKEEGDIMNGKK